MDYKEKYEKALEKATAAYKDEDRHLKATLERIFPELKESVDERIRINIISWLKNMESQTIPINEYNSAIAWLEKQGEQESLCDKCRKEHPSHSCQDITELGRCAVEHEQKNDWSEEDEKFFKTALWHISNSISNGKSTDIHCDTTDWFKSLKERVQPQNRWKPSDKQMDVLLSEVTAWTKGCPKQIVLESLFNDLKKLTE